MLHLTRLLSLSLLSLPLALASACNEVENGELGLVDFVPDECGQSGCDLDDGLAVGATTEVYLDGANGEPVDDLWIDSSAPWIVEVLENRPGLSPRAVIAGNDEGYADLLAVDQFGYVVDYVMIHVAAADELSVDVLALEGPGVDGPHANDAADDLYFTQAGQGVEIDVTALDDGSPVMGRIEYTVVTDAEMAAGIGQQDVSDGRFTIVLPRGEHQLFIANATTWRTIHFSVE